MKKIVSALGLLAVSSLALAYTSAPAPIGHLSIQNGTACLEDDYGHVTLVKPINVYAYSYDPATGKRQYAGATVSPNETGVIPLFAAAGVSPQMPAAYLGTDTDTPVHTSENIPGSRASYLVVQGYSYLQGNVCPKSDPCAEFASTATAQQCLTLLQSR